MAQLLKIDRLYLLAYDQLVNVEIPQELAQMVEAKVNSGLYADYSQVVQEGLRLLEERDQAFQESNGALKESLARGLREADAGLLMPGAEVFAELRKDLESRL